MAIEADPSIPALASLQIWGNASWIAETNPSPPSLLAFRRPRQAVSLKLRWTSPGIEQRRGTHPLCSSDSRNSVSPWRTKTYPVRPATLGPWLNASS
jgi:hypothetical protein